MKKIIIAIFAALVAVAAGAQEQQQVQNQVVEETVNDYKIVSDEVVDGVRYVTATPSAKVCSKQIDIEIKDGIIQKVVYTRGCEGNAKGIGALIKDMSVEEAIRRLDGITCGKRGTSCPDQLARILKAL
ncbi:MAG: TIGR03905 family TSCPD domain-containing protein [Bacteroidales bacterium]|nr:TIGR03905 family TSCPD domain-containing protein [Bacteroidales bacterium]